MTSEFFAGREIHCGAPHVSEGEGQFQSPNFESMLPSWRFQSGALLW
jgi:hypothetical protein